MCAGVPVVNVQVLVVSVCVYGECGVLIVSVHALMVSVRVLILGVYVLLPVSR
jgi:hypothetical protein